MAFTLLERLARGPLLADGAMGTLLNQRGVEFESCFDELNLSRPGLIESIHREYLAAGAELIETNTFGANAVRLAVIGQKRFGRRRAGRLKVDVKLQTAGVHEHARLDCFQQNPRR